MQKNIKFASPSGNSIRHSSRRPEDENRSKQPFSLSGKRAVIVEDEGMIVLQLRNILRRAGMIVVDSAINGKEGVEIVLRERPDLVLMDINMPVMNGLEASEHILAAERVCIVILTAFSEEECQQRAQALGVCGYVLKPVTAEILLPELEAAYKRYHQA